MISDETEKRASPKRQWWLLIAALGAVLGGFIAVSRRAAPDAIPTQVVATINETQITLAEFEAEVQLQAVKNELTGRDRKVEKPALFNRMIGDILLLQAANEAGVNASPDMIEAEIDAILGRYDTSREEMTALLEQHGLSWAIFEESIHQYLTMSQYIDDDLLADVAAGERKAFLDNWMSEQYEEASLSFDQSFLDSINVSDDQLDAQ